MAEVIAGKYLLQVFLRLKHFHSLSSMIVTDGGDCGDQNMRFGTRG